MPLDDERLLLGLPRAPENPMTGAFVAGTLSIGKRRDDQGDLRHGQGAPSSRLGQEGRSGFEHGQLSTRAA